MAYIDFLSAVHKSTTRDYLARSLGACQVSRLGNMPLTAEMLNAELAFEPERSEMPDSRQSAA